MSTRMPLVSRSLTASRRDIPRTSGMLDSETVRGVRVTKPSDVDAATWEGSSPFSVVSMVNGSPSVSYSEVSVLAEPFMETGRRGSSANKPDFRSTRSGRVPWRWSAMARKTGAATTPP